MEHLNSACFLPHAREELFFLSINHRTKDYLGPGKSSKQLSRFSHYLNVTSAGNSPQPSQNSGRTHGSGSSTHIPKIRRNSNSNSSGNSHPQDNRPSFNRSADSKQVSDRQRHEVKTWRPPPKPTPSATRQRSPPQEEKVPLKTTSMASPPSSRAPQATALDRWISDRTKGRRVSEGDTTSGSGSGRPSSSSWQRHQEPADSSLSSLSSLNFPRVSSETRKKVDQILVDIRALTIPPAPPPGPEDPRVQDILEFLVLESGMDALADFIRELGERKRTELAVALFQITENKYGNLLDIGSYNAAVYALACNGELEAAEALVARLNAPSSGLAPSPLLASLLLRHHISLRNLPSALALLRALPQRLGVRPELQHYKVLLQHIGGAAVGVQGVLHFDTAFRLLREMRAEGVQPDQESYEFLIRIAASKKVPVMALRLLEDMEQLGTPSLRACNQVMRALAMKAMVDEARHLLRRMEQWGVPPSVETYSWFINTVGKRANAEDLDLVMEKLAKTSLLQDENILFNLLGGYGKADKWERVEEILEMASRVGCRNHPEIVKTLVVCYGRARRFQEMEEELQRHRASGSRVNPVVYVRMMEAYCAAGAAYLPEVCRTLTICDAISVKLPDHSEASLVAVLGKAGYTDLARTLARSMIARDSLAPSVYHTFLEMFCSMGRMEDVRELLAHVKAQEPLLLSHWTVALRALEDAPLADVREVFEDLVSVSGGKPSRYCNEFWTRTLARYGLLEEALSMLATCFYNWKDTTAEVYDAILSACWWALEWGKAEALFQNDAAKPWVPSVEAKMAMIGVYSGLGDWESCEGVFDSLSSHGAPFRAYSLLLDAYVHGGEVARGERLAQQIEALGYGVEAQNWRIRLYGGSEDFEGMLSVYSTLLSGGAQEPDATTFASIMEVCVKNGKLPEALQIAKQAADRFMVGEVELFNAILAAFPLAIGEGKVQELLRAGRELNFPGAVTRLLEGTEASRGLRTLESNSDLQGLRTFAESLAAGSGKPEAEREFFNRLVDALWAQGKESLAIEVAIVGAERGMYLYLSARQALPNGDASVLLNLRTVSVGVAQIALFVWLSSQLRLLRDRTQVWGKTTFVVSFGKGRTEVDRQVRRAVEGQLDSLLSPFTWEQSGTALAASGEAMEGWLVTTELSRALVVKNGRLKPLSAEESERTDHLSLTH